MGRLQSSLIWAFSFIFMDSECSSECINAQLLWALAVHIWAKAHFLCVMGFAILSDDLMRYSYHICPKNMDTITFYHTWPKFEQVHSATCWCVWKLLAECHSVDTDQMLKNVASDLGLHRLLKPVCPNTYVQYFTVLLFLKIKWSMIYQTLSNMTPQRSLCFVHSTNIFSWSFLSDIARRLGVKAEKCCINVSRNQRGKVLSKKVPGASKYQQRIMLYVNT